MKIFGFNGSPRRNGNTAFLVNAILGEAERNGVSTEMRHSCDLTISPCVSCLGCRQGDRHCVVNDGMRGVYSSILSADAIVLGTPVYMGQMSGQTKVFIDRLSAEFHPRFSPHRKEENAGKRLALVFTQGNPDDSMFKSYIDYTKSMFEKLSFEVVEPILIAAGTRSVPASGNDDYPAQAQKLGRLLCGR